MISWLSSQSLTIICWIYSHFTIRASEIVFTRIPNSEITRAKTIDNQIIKLQNKN